jgi:hypothetical protein
MLKEKIILAFFIKTEKIDNFLSFIEGKYNIERKDVYIYTVKGNDREYFITFKFNKSNNFIKHKEYGKPIHIHIKYSCLFSINALNKYIELNNEGIEKGNLDYKHFQIDWSTLKNKLLLIRDNNLKIETLIKVEKTNKEEKPIKKNKRKDIYN